MQVIRAQIEGADDPFAFRFAHESQTLARQQSQRAGAQRRVRLARRQQLAGIGQRGNGIGLLTRYCQRRMIAARRQPYESVRGCSPSGF